MRHGNFRILASPAFALFLGHSLLTCGMQAGEWRQFRGPDGNGSLSQLEHPLDWSADTNVAWTAEIAGGGWSSPVVVGDRVILTTAVSSAAERPKGFGGGVAAMRQHSQAKPPQEPVSFEVHCLSKSDGSEIWRRVIEQRKPSYPIHPSNTYATESPVTDGTRVYVYFAAIGSVACLDLQGQQLWKRDLGAFPTSNNFGTGSSLTMHEGRVFVQCDNQKQSFLLALDALSGQDLWRVERRGRTCWSSPVVWTNRLRAELVVCGSGYVCSYDPASGEQLWEIEGTDGSFSASPASDTDRVYFGNSGPGRRGPLMAVNAGGSGKLRYDRSQEGEGDVAWIESASGPGMASPVSHAGRLYVTSRGVLTCHDAATGRRLYRARLPGASSVAASLWAADDKLFILDESGTTFVVKIGDEFELLGKNALEGLFWSTPSVAGDSLLLRSAGKLHCVRGPVAVSGLPRARSVR